MEGNAVLAPWMASSSRGNAAPAAGPDSALDPRDRLEARLRAAEAERRDLEAEVVAVEARLAQLRAEIAEDRDLEAELAAAEVRLVEAEAQQACAPSEKGHPSREER